MADLMFSAGHAWADLEKMLAAIAFSRATQRESDHKEEYLVSCQVNHPLIYARKNHFYSQHLKCKQIQPNTNQAMRKMRLSNAIDQEKWGQASTSFHFRKEETVKIVADTLPQ